VADVGPLPRPIELLPAAGADVVAVGRLPGTQDTLSALRVTPTGTVDQTFGGSTGIRFKPGFGGGAGSPAGIDPSPGTPLAQDSFAAHAVAVRPDGSYLAVGGVDVAGPAGAGRTRASFAFATAALTPDFAPLSGFGGPARPLRVKLSIPPQTAAAAASRHAVEVRLDVSAAGLTRVTVRASGHLIARTVAPIFGAGPRLLGVALTRSGAAVLASPRAVRVTASATARNLVIQGATASASGTLG
jgi:hypothetical protein